MAQDDAREDVQPAAPAKSHAEADGFEESPAKRVRLDPEVEQRSTIPNDVAERLRGVAPVKKEYVLCYLTFMHCLF
jgi:hypothetical protein